MLLLTDKHNDKNKNNDILIDIDQEAGQSLPFKSFKYDEKFQKLVEQEVEKLQTDKKLLEEFKQSKLEPLEQENKELKEKLEAWESEKEELSQKIEQLEKENKQLQEQVKELEESSKPSKEYDSEVLESLIFPINTIDQIAAAYRNTGENELVAEQLEKVAELTIQQIASVGIEEIPVYGKEIDGSYMESFGPASHVKDKSLPPHSVAIVSRRAFKRKDSDEIIQHALVYTVPEEE